MPQEFCKKSETESLNTRLLLPTRPYVGYSVLLHIVLMGIFLGIYSIIKLKLTLKDEINF